MGTRIAVRAVSSHNCSDRGPACPACGDRSPLLAPVISGHFPKSPVSKIPRFQNIRRHAEVQAPNTAELPEYARKNGAPIHEGRADPVKSKRPNSHTSTSTHYRHCTPSHGTITPRLPIRAKFPQRPKPSVQNPAKWPEPADRTATPEALTLRLALSTRTACFPTQLTTPLDPKRPGEVPRHATSTPHHYLTPPQDTSSTLEHRTTQCKEHDGARQHWLP